MTNWNISVFDLGQVVSLIVVPITTLSRSYFLEFRQLFCVGWLACDTASERHGVRLCNQIGFALFIIHCVLLNMRR